MELPEGTDPPTIQNIALDLEDDLITGGYDILSVTPWARPSLGLEPEEDMGLF
jgi:hypothetical protein